MYDLIKSLFIPKVETPGMIASRELNETELDLLKTHKQLEYYQSQREMLLARHERLTLVIRTGSFS